MLPLLAPIRVISFLLGYDRRPAYSTDEDQSLEDRLSHRTRGRGMDDLEPVSLNRMNPTLNDVAS